MESPLPTIPRRLFKYVTSERLDVLKNECIRFTQPSALNDPWELKPHVEKLMTNDEEEIQTVTSIIASEFPSIFEEVVQEEWSEMTDDQHSSFPGGYGEYWNKSAQPFIDKPDLVLQFFDIMKTIVKGVTPELTKASVEWFTSQVGILSLTSKDDNDLMWAHYADSHRGMVLEFDTSHDFFTSYSGKIPFNCRPVLYCPNRPSFANIHQLSQALQQKDTFDEIFFLTKSQSWFYEEEWRMARMLAESDKTLGTDIPAHLFNLPTACITGLILGAKMPDAKRQEIIDLVRTDPRYSHVELSQAKLSSRTFALEIKRI